MVFKRRDRRPIWRILREAIWPRGGWTRAVKYVTHRLNRLPDPPNRIARGIFVGVFVAFTPFYGLHFFLAAAVAWLVRGNVIAAILGTLFGNPLTYVPIGVIALETGYFLLGVERSHAPGTLGRTFAGAGQDLWHNAKALFGPAQPHWDDLWQFYDDVFFPYMIGGILPGLVAGLACYHLSLPVITAYQNRRRGLLKDRLDRLKSRKRGNES